MLGYEGSSYTLYEDDGIHKDYNEKENYRVLTKQGNIEFGYV